MHASRLSLAAQLQQLIEPQLGRIKRPAAGALRHDFLCPAGPYDEQWDWDGFFMGVALASRNASEARYLRNWCLNFIANSATDGHTPGVITPAGADPRLHHMKPFLAQGAYLAMRYLNDADWVNDIYPRLRLMVDYREEHLWDKHRGLGVWHDAMESGADNNVAFTDEAERTAGADLNTFIHREYMAMALIAERLGRTSDHASYMQRAGALLAAVNTHLWSADDTTYYNLDILTGAHIKRITYSNFVPLWGGMASHEHGEQQLTRYLLEPRKMWSAHGGRTLAVDDPAYNNVNMIKPYSNWQGPVWAISNYLYMHALLRYGFQADAITLAERITRLCLRDVHTTGGMHENYDAETGEPLAAPGFLSWNILVPEMLQQAISNGDPFALN
jgi:alpha,alpha-trehalase